MIEREDLIAADAGRLVLAATGDDPPALPRLRVCRNSNRRGTL